MKSAGKDGIDIDIVLYIDRTNSSAHVRTETTLLHQKTNLNDAFPMCTATVDSPHMYPQWLRTLAQPVHSMSPMSVFSGEFEAASRKSTLDWTS